MTGRFLGALISAIVGAFVSASRSAAGFLQRRARLPGVRTVLTHWSHEARTVRQGLLALSIGISITLVAGVVLGAMDQLLEDLPGLLVLAPAAIGMRGAIFSALAARLGTGMLTGQLEGPVSRRSFLGQNLEASGVLSLVTAVLLAAAARLAGVITGADSISFTDLVLVSVIGAVLSSGVVLVVVLLLTRTAQRLAWDMDAIGTPIISATADISTLPALVVGTLALGNATVSGVAGGLIVALAIALAAVGVTSSSEQAKRIVRESLPILIYTAAMGVIAGAVLEARKDVLISSAALLVAIPPFISSSGAIGGILSARLSSQLHLGLLSPDAIPGRPARLEASLSILFAIVAYFTIGVLTAGVSAAFGYASPGLPKLVAICVIAGLMAVTVIVAVSYYAATASFRFGLDPDNVGIPMVTSTMDFAGILCLATGIALVGS